MRRSIGIDSLLFDLSSGDTVVSLTPPTKEKARVQERIEADREKQSQSKE